jgi:hypothetical protein
MTWLPKTYMFILVRANALHPVSGDVRVPEP